MSQSLHSLLGFLQLLRAADELLVSVVKLSNMLTASFISRNISLQRGGDGDGDSCWGLTQSVLSWR